MGHMPYSAWIFRSESLLDWHSPLYIPSSPASSGNNLDTTASGAYAVGVCAWREVWPSALLSLDFRSVLPTEGQPEEREE